ncbi:tyrosine--tRNA ligase [Spirochaeta cellobiosiphila]|uniref:tyrosine--tRNA ligase n=1 Tax=Spirochaeta cellobiosiphila TaxID=504483 RepID=UPI0004226F5D|nr:tyrosine--tRNA ligase [Spirochaeta cellobiosiphila]
MSELLEKASQLDLDPGLKSLLERGFLQQCTDIEGLNKKMKEGPVTFYSGIDPTGPSAHVGHMVPIFAMTHLKNAGHNPILLIGGGTARLGDPSGKTEMRKMLSYEDIAKNGEAQAAQLKNFISFDDGSGKLMNNADWLANLNYIDFLREIGSQFSVNRMLTFEAYKQRMETGLSFVEFNYQLLQSYDFLELNRQENCHLQIGGDDQWGNIVAGIDLIRRMESKEVFGLTFPLITRADGKKMGKSEKGAIFLNPDMCPIFDFFQYWRNVDDRDVKKFLKLFTFLSLEEIETLTAGTEAKDINRAKEILAFEYTKLIHGEEEAQKALDGARAAFSQGGAGSKEGMPSGEYSQAQIQAGINIMDLFTEVGLCQSKSEARRLVQQNGAAINGEKYNNIDYVVNDSHIDEEGDIILKAGKKRFFRIIVK